MLAVLYHDIFLRHLDHYPHVERPERLMAVMERLGKPPLAGMVRIIEAEPAEIAWLERVHDARYVKGILTLAVDDAVMLDWGDTVATPATPQAALYAAGAGVQAARLVLAGIYPAAFCAVRPPGHHAEPDRAMGFCIFNNIAVAAADLLAEGGLKRVAIVDWDIHHGNGTERMFLDDDRVLYISLHQYPHYPGTGNPATTGMGAGAGFTINLPLGAGAGDRECLEVFDTRVLPALDDFKPEFILISAGFDGHLKDPLSGTRFSSALYDRMTRGLVACARKHSQGRIVSFLEGGYDLDALAESVETHLMALVEP